VSPKRMRFCALVVAMLLLPIVFGAQGNNPSTKTSPWKPEDIIYAENITDALTGRSRHREGEKDEDERISNLFLTLI
jgi:hypothetical protein